MAFDESERDDLLDRLVEEFTARLRRGERPALKDYTDRHPDLANEIRELFPALANVEKVAGNALDDAQTPPPAGPRLSEIVDYRIVREIGHGGMRVRRPTGSS